MFGQHLSKNLYPSLYMPRLQSGTQTVTGNETHSLLVSRVAPRLSPGMRHTPSSSPEWHPNCHLDRDALPPHLQSGTKTVTWNKTFSLRPAFPTLGTWPALGIPLAPSSVTHPGTWSRDTLNTMPSTTILDGTWPVT